MAPNKEDSAGDPVPAQSLAAQVTRSTRSIVVVMSCVIVVTAILAWQLLFRLHPDIRHYTEASRSLAGARQGMIDQETFLRGYLLTGESRLLSGYPQAQIAVGVNMAKLGNELKSDVALSQLYESTKAAQEKWLKEWAEPAVQRGSLVATPGAARFSDNGFVNEGKTLFDTYRSIQETLRVALIDRRDQALDAERTAIAVGLAIELVIALSMLVLTRIQYRKLKTAIIGPLTDLLDTINRIATGDLSAKASGKGPSEFVAIADGLNDMVSKLSASQALTRAQAEELAAARDRAMETTELKSEFLANMSHEIRTPLNGVIGMTGLLLETPLTSEQKEFAATARASGNALLSIINDILDFSKIEAGKMVLEEIDFDLRSVVEEVGDLLSVQAHSKNLELSIYVHPDAAQIVSGDPGRLRQVLTNLAGNAVKFTNEGNVVIEVKPVNAEIPGWTTVRFEVRDSGIGLSPERQEQLFEAFTQADASTTRQFGGTGLGLAISKQLVELMGGKIGVKSNLGSGSVFWFEISLKLAVDSPAQIPVSDVKKFSSLSVLVVDDNAINRRILEQQLRGWGIKPTLARDGGNALELLRSAIGEGSGFDLVILDNNMPGLQGTEVAELIAEDENMKEINIIMLSSSLESWDSKSEIRDRIVVSLNKPAHQSQLYEALCVVVSGNQSANISKPLASGAATDVEVSSGHVLIVEDNPTNQRVAALMLKKLGYEVQTAANGLEAVEVAKNGQFVAILMDCQMPELDGYEATRRIRRDELQAGADIHTPIIAMTASALQGERERCLNAGMDDYLSKPVTLESLAKTMLRHITATTSPSTTPQIDLRTEINVSEEVIDLTYIKQLQATIGGSDKEVFVDIINQYTESVSDSVESLKTAFEAKDAEAVAFAAHRLAGSSSTLRAKNVASTAREIERFARADELGKSQALMEKLMPEIETANAALLRVASSKS